MAANANLYKQLKDSCRKDGFHEGRKYIPEGAVNEIITRDSVKAELIRKSRSRINLSGCLANKVVKKAAKKGFAILVYLDQPWHIKRLLDDGFTDEDLPLLVKPELNGMQSSLDPTKIFYLSEDGDDRIVDEFLMKQWMLLAPVFVTSSEHKVLDSQCPLPFSDVDERIYAHSHNSVIYKAKIHPSHQEGFEPEASSLQVALKQFRKLDQFTKERKNLDIIRLLKRNEHMTLNLGSFSQEGRFYLIFPWAEGGDLENLWKDGNSRLRTPELALWSLRQMCGLAETLEALHLGFDESTNCRHGDLKPQNILHFLTNGEGILKITDFGISSIHENATFERKETPTVTRATTPSYQAPEAAPALLEKQARSRKYDIWSLGCIFLEFTIWLVGGWEDVESFNEERKPEPATDATLSHFYDITDGKARVHPVVSQRITQLKTTSRIKQGTALGDLLEIIDKHLLKVEVKKRFDAGKLCQSLRNIVHKAESGPIHPFNPTSSAALA